MCDLIYRMLVEKKAFRQFKLKCMTGMLISSCGYGACTKSDVPERGCSDFGALLLINRSELCKVLMSHGPVCVAVFRNVSMYLWGDRNAS